MSEVREIKVLGDWAYLHRLGCTSPLGGPARRKRLQRRLLQLVTPPMGR